MLFEVHLKQTEKRGRARRLPALPDSIHSKEILKHYKNEDIQITNHHPHRDNCDKWM